MWRQLPAETRENHVLTVIKQIEPPNGLGPVPNRFNICDFTLERIVQSDGLAEMLNFIFDRDSAIQPPRWQLFIQETTRLSRTTQLYEVAARLT
ncbi:hypothetical protein JCM8547_003440 [Rhodosporidiobolus lusitaniae]